MASLLTRFQQKFNRDTTSGVSRDVGLSLLLSDQTVPSSQSASPDMVERAAAKSMTMDVTQLQVVSLTGALSAWLFKKRFLLVFVLASWWLAGVRCLLPAPFLRVRILPCWVGFLCVGGWVFLPFAFLARVVSVPRPRLRCFLNGSRGIVNAMMLQSFVRTVPLPDVSRSLIQERLESFDARLFSNSGMASE